MESLDELRDEIKILADNHIDTDELVRIANAIEREVEEKYVELPKDANGEYIHIGDVMLQSDSITKRSCKAIMDSGYVMLDGIQSIVYAKWLTHYHEPTVEDVLREFALEIDPSADVDVSGVKTITEFAKRLQLREES